MIGSGTPARSQTSVDQPAVQEMTVSASTAPRVVSTPVTRPFSRRIAGHLGVRVQLDSAPVGAARVAPDDGVVADDPAGRVVERAHHRPGDVLREVHLRAESRDLVRVDQAAVDPEQLVHLGALGHRDHRPVGVGERQVALLREEEVEVELGAEALVEADALLVEARALGRAVVGADDRRVAAGRARAEVALLEHGDVRDPVVLRQVVRGREPVRAAADDHDVVARLQLLPWAPHAPDAEDVLHSSSSRSGSIASRTTSSR